MYTQRSVFNIRTFEVARCFRHLGGFCCPPEQLRSYVRSRGRPHLLHELLGNPGDPTTLLSIPRVVWTTAGSSSFVVSPVCRLPALFLIGERQSLPLYTFNACLHRLRSRLLPPPSRHFPNPLLFVLLECVSSGPHGPHPLRFLGATNSCEKDVTPGKAAYRGECP